MPTLSATYLPPCTELGQLPPAASLQHLALLNEDCTAILQTSSHSSSYLNGVQIGGRLPPVPKKLVEKIESGQYVEMSELRPDQLGYAGSPKQQGKKKAISNILE